MKKTSEWGSKYWSIIHQAICCSSNTCLLSCCAGLCPGPAYFAYSTIIKLTDMQSFTQPTCAYKYIYVWGHFLSLFLKCNGIGLVLTFDWHRRSGDKIRIGKKKNSFDYVYFLVAVVQQLRHTAAMGTLIPVIKWGSTSIYLNFWIQCNLYIFFKRCTGSDLPELC